ncbi:MAG: hypothetical protein U1F00_02355 [Rhodoferax sp.]
MTVRVLAAGGLLVGALFGFFAQRSRFCLHAAVIEFWRRQFGEKLSMAPGLLECVVAVPTPRNGTSAGRWQRTADRCAQQHVRGLPSAGGLLFSRDDHDAAVLSFSFLSANGNLRAAVGADLRGLVAQASLSAAWRPSVDQHLVDRQAGASRDLLALTGIETDLDTCWWDWCGSWRRSPLRDRGGWNTWKWIGGVGTGLYVAAMLVVYLAGGLSFV